MSLTKEQKRDVWRKEASAADCFDVGTTATAERDKEMAVADLCELLRRCKELGECDDISAEYSRVQRRMSKMSGRDKKQAVDALRKRMKRFLDEPPSLPTWQQPRQQPEMTEHNLVMQDTHDPATYDPGTQRTDDPATHVTDDLLLNDPLLNDPLLNDPALAASRQR